MKHSTKHLVECVIGSIMVTTLGVFLLVDPASPSGNRVAHAQEQTSVSDARPQTAAGTTPPLVDLDITFAPSRQTLSVGDAWSVTGEIYNRSKERPIWLVDTRTMLIVAPEVFGDVVERFGVPAYFPTLVYGNYWDRDRTVRVEAGSKYPVIWMVRSNGPLSAIWGYSFFSPGSFRATAVVHYWTEPPPIGWPEEAPWQGPEARLRNMDGSSTAIATRDLSFDASLWVLLWGAPLGGIAALILQKTLGRSPLPGISGRRPALVRNVIGAILLPAVVTILLARLLSADAPITIRVRDVWGAVAMGFVVQWVGVNLLSRLIPVEPDRAEPADAVGRNPIRAEPSPIIAETNGNREATEARLKVENRDR